MSPLLWPALLAKVNNEHSVTMGSIQIFVGRRQLLESYIVDPLPLDAHFIGLHS